MNQSTESSEPTFTVAEEQAPITARSGSGVAQGSGRSGTSRRSNDEAVIAVPLSELPEERGFFADGEVGRYLGGPEEFADAGSFSEVMAERPASTLQRWTSLAVVLAVAGAVAGGTVMATGWLDGWLGKGRRAELAAVSIASSSEGGQASRDEAEGAPAEPTPPAASVGASLTAMPVAVPPAATMVVASSALPADSQVDSAQVAPSQTDHEQPATSAAVAEPGPTAAPVEAPSPADSTPAALGANAAETAPNSRSVVSSKQSAPPKPRAEAPPPRVRAAQIATPRPTGPSGKKSFATGPAKATAPPATPAPAKKPSVVSFPTH